MTDQAFLEQLHELNNKINAVKEQAFRETMACTDVADILDKLKAKVGSRDPGRGHEGAVGLTCWIPPPVSPF